MDLRRFANKFRSEFEKITKEQDDAYDVARHAEIMQAFDHALALTALRALEEEK